MSSTPPNQDFYPCGLCSGDHWSIDCHEWTAVPTNLADAKALFAKDSMSLTITEDK